MNSFPKKLDKLVVFELKVVPCDSRAVLDVMDAIFCKYRSIRGYEKKSGSKILFFHEEILISKFGLGIFFGIYLKVGLLNFENKTLKDPTKKSSSPCIHRSVPGS